MEPNISIELVKNDMKYIKEGVDKLNNEFNKLDQKFVSKIEFELTNKNTGRRITQIEKLVFGAVTLGLITLGKAILDVVQIVHAE